MIAGAVVGALLLVGLSLSAVLLVVARGRISGRTIVAVADNGEDALTLSNPMYQSVSREINLEEEAMYISDDVSHGYLAVVKVEEEY